MNTIQEKFITLRDISYSKALILKMQLEMRGVNCFITNIQAGDSIVDIHLEEAFSETAFRLLEEMQRGPATDKEVVVKQLRSVRRILVPVDFSDRSIKAAHYALELARTLKAEIKLLHVWFNSTGETFIFNEMFAFQTNLEPVMREMEHQALQQLTDLSDSLIQRVRSERMRGVSVKIDLVRGSTVDSILDIAHEYQPGLIVMGTRGKNRDTLHIMGSTTSKLIAKSKVPVMVIPEGYDINHFYAPHHLAYITHFDDDDFFALHRLMTFIRPFKPKVYCLHIQSDIDPVFDRLRMRQLRNYFQSSYATVDIECGLIETADPVEGLEAFVKEMKIDVIAIMMRRRNLLEKLLEPSLTKQLLFQSTTPLLVFRETNEATGK
ncbi:MAG: UspA domain-containing protein [Bacteroidetes bacterium]|nr:MAG: UspA domain-containing protein [Bacteroidota bacterium]